MHRNSNITDNLNSTFLAAGILNFGRLENVDNQHCYSCKNTFTFTGKEKDSLRLNPQSGGLCGARLTSPPDLFTRFYYFGARYYDPSISGLFLSVDPMADKYPSISPYYYSQNIRGGENNRLTSEFENMCRDIFIGKYHLATKEIRQGRSSENH